MKRTLIAAALALALPLAAPLSAQEAEPDGEAGRGFSLMEEGARLILRGLMNEMGPALDEMEGFAEEVRPQLRAFAQEFGPALAELMSMIDEVGNYRSPEVLPNGDIIIRRRDDAPPYEPPEDAIPQGEVEL